LFLVPLIRILPAAFFAGSQEDFVHMAWGNVTKTTWSDKFRQPRAEELRAGLSKSVQQVFDDARERLSELDAGCEWLVWQGVPWRWTFVYMNAGAAESRAFAYLIPDPARLQICVPLSDEVIERLPLKRMKKSIRDGIVFARHVAGVSWPTWDVATKTALDEVFELIARKQAMASGVESGATVGT
jgi:hypothetical protein